MFEFNATFLIAMVSFVLFIIIMNKILYEPILSVINERQDYIDKNNNAALDSKNMSKSILDDKEKKLNDAAIASKKLISERVIQENNTSAKLTEDARIKSLSDIDSAKKDLQHEVEQTKEALKNNVKDLAENISSKILGENITIDTVDDELIDRELKWIQLLKFGIQ